MNPQQLWAILQLRWQMSRNQWRRAGTLNTVLAMVGTVLLLATSVFAFFEALIGGSLLLHQVEPDYVLLLWDVLAVGFLFCWMIGLMTELQRSELLSLEKLLHLPLSLSGAFALNYISSWFSFSLLLFLPLTIGLSLAFVVTKGPLLLLLFPLLFAFVILVTGVTYQFRGWLAGLMQNKRRRGTVIAIMTISFIVLAQAPNIINFTYFRTVRDASHQDNGEWRRQNAELQKQLQDGTLTPQEVMQRSQDLLDKQIAVKDSRFQASFQNALHWVRLANLILPVGWLPFGAHALVQGRPLPAILCAAGMLAIGLGALWRSYYATMRLQTGANLRVPIPTAPVAVNSTRKKELFVSRQIPFISDQVAAIALTSFCAALRSPEAKMMLITPILFVGMFGSAMLLGPKAQFPAEAVPLVLLAGIGITVFSAAQFVCNAFSIDRSGFRAFILMPVARRDILYGKNLSLVPMILGLNVMILSLAALAFPLRIMHVPVSLIQAINAYLLLCLAGNLLTIRFPSTMAVGSLKPQNVRVVPVLMQLLLMMLSPIVLLPAVAAWGIEFLVEYLTGFHLIPWALLLSIVESALILRLYSLSLDAEGRFLQQRETHILEVVAAANE